MTEQYDVAIIGTGIGGTALAAILARHNFRVLMIEKSSHPRFAIGEAVLPKTALLMRIIGDYYDIPEIAAFGNVDSIQKHVVKSCGVKRINGYLYHKENQKQNPAESHMFVPTRLPLGDPPHLFRQDVDHFMLKAAIKHGAAYRDQTSIADFQIDDEKVMLETDEGERFQARYLIDAAGFHSPVARNYKLRQDPEAIRTNSRTIFTHMENVPRYEDLIDPADNPGLSRNWSDGTLHHVFDGGWMWVIPFNNLDGSTNSLCSVGLSLDIEKYPDTGLTAEEEFHTFLKRFPGIAAQFAQAKPVRPWVKTPRLQYTSSRGVGDRFYLLPNCHSFTDALQSTGMVCTFESIHRFADHLLLALAEDDLSASRFADIDHHHTQMADFVDRHLANFYTSFADFSLWNVWLRLHVIFEIMAYTSLVRRYARYLESGDRQEFRDLPSVVYPNFPELQELFDRAENAMQQFGRGELTAQAASSQIYAMLSESDSLPPLFDWSTPEYNHIDMNTFPEMAKKVSVWAKTKAPAKIREQIYNFDRSELEKVNVQEKVKADVIAKWTNKRSIWATGFPFGNWPKSSVKRGKVFA